MARRRPPERTVVLLYHKPPQVVTTHASDDPLGRRNVYEDVASMVGFVGPRREKPPSRSRRREPSHSVSSDFQDATGIRPGTKLHAVGRLDADTTGLLLLTNDGGLVHHATNKNARSLRRPRGSIDHDGHDDAEDETRAAIPKTYEATIMGRHDDASLLLCRVRSRDGVDLGPKHGGRTMPVLDARVLDHPSPSTTTVSVTLAEGKNRQIRRVFHALGSGVIRLKRVRIGSHLTLDGLEPEGSWRVLSDDEVRGSLRWTPRLLDGSTSPYRPGPSCSSSPPSPPGSQPPARRRPPRQR
jgi:23S rRNA pseudouridine2605 synthase